MDKMDEMLQHAGVKGMKWGVIRSKVSGGASKAGGATAKVASKAGSAVVTKVKNEVNSIKREASWGKIKADGMTTEQITKLAQRAQLENDFKRISKTKNVGNRKDKAEYKVRESMSDQELMTKVTRLRAKENLDRNMKEATKSQRTLGRNVIDAAGPLVVKAALKQKIGLDDVTTALATLKKKDKAIDPGQFKNEVAKAAFGVAGQVKVKSVMGADYDPN